MASRNERRRRAKERRDGQQDAPAPSHGGRMMASVVQKSADPQQLTEDQQFLDLYEGDKAIPPPLPLDGLWQLYEENTVHSGCINAKIADSVGRGWHLEQEDESEDGSNTDASAETRMVRDWLAERCKDPNGMPMPWSAIASQWVREYDATGWGVLEIGREGEEIALISPLPAHTLRATKDPDVYVQVRGQAKVYFKRFGAEGSVDAKTGVKGDGGAEDEANEVLILKHYTPRTPHYGIPYWISGVPTLAELVAIREYNVSWHESGGVGDKIIHVKANDDEVAETLKDGLVEQFKQTKGRGHSTYFTYGTADTEVEVEPLSKSEGNRDGQFKERRYDLNTELLIGHQVPSYRVGWAVMGTLGGNAAEEMIDSYRYGVVEPMQEHAETLLNMTIFNGELGGLELPGYTFAFDDVDWAEMETELEKANAGVKLGTITPNDWREMVGLDRDDEDPALDLYWVMTASGPMQLGAVAPEVNDATDVVREMKKALDVVVKGVQDEPGAPEERSDAEGDD